jgi:cytochrome c2
LTPKNAAALADAPGFATEGALVYQANRCGACHKINGTGMTVGPPLNGVARRRTRDWVERHFRDPQATSPGTIMPPYPLPARDMENLVQYLFTLAE